jgi:hypothetical protein
MFKRFARSPGSRIVVARRCRVRTGFSICSTVKHRNSRCFTWHRHREAEPTTATPQEARPQSTVREFSAAWWLGVRSAPRAPAVGPAGLFVYDNNNGTHRTAKRTRWVVLTRRRRADLSDRVRGRRVVGRAIPRGGSDGEGACLRHARRRV